MTFPKDTGEYMQTFTGVTFHLRQPSPDMVRVEDIAHHLATLNRWTGALRVPMSIAQHAVLTSFLAAPGFEFAALHHDDHEAYTNDLSSPMKRTLLAAGDQQFRRTAMAIQWAINAHFEIPLTLGTAEDDIVKRADLVALRMEADYGFANPPLWVVDYPEPDAEERSRVPLWILEPLGWREAEHVYLSRHEQLLTERRRD